MKKLSILLLSVFPVALIFAAATKSEGQQASKKQIVATAGHGETYPGPGEYFTGRAVVQSIAPETSPSRNVIAYVTFEAGARSNWHTHDGGQTLVVTSGTAWTQEWEGSAYEAKPGDVIYCPPGVKHFHGASPEAPMTHVSIVENIDGKNVTWLEPVTDVQYEAAGYQIRGK